MNVRKIKMSFRERTLPKSSSLKRSFSFGGFLNSKNLTSPTSPMGAPILGAARTPSMQKKTLSGFGISFSNKKLKIPKVPRPQRALMVFEHVKNGINQCIEVTDEDIYNMRANEEKSMSSTGQAKVLEIEKQIKAAERYKKKLEFHLSKIEELEENYKLQQQLREGVKNMAKAFTLQMNSPKKSSLFNIKAGFKECTQVMCTIEAQLESMLGTFHCELQGLAGFARMMPGDVYEVIIRHGHQKWKSKGKIGLNSQTWEHNTFVFKAMIGDILNIKASELRTMKSVTLGHKNCEIKDLFSSHPQMMTVSLNTNGSIKLSLVVNWNPLEGGDDSYFVTEAISGASNRRVHSMYVTSLPYYIPASILEESGSETSGSLSDLSSDVSSNEDQHNHHFPMPGYGFHTYMLPSPKLDSDDGKHGLYNHPQNFGASSSSAVRPKSIAIMGTINESTTDYAIVKSDNSGVASGSNLNYTTAYSPPDSLRYSTPDLGHINFHNLGAKTDLSGKSHLSKSFSPEMSPPMINGDHYEQLGQPQIVKRPLTRTSSKFIELGPRKPTKSSFSKDISMYTPKSLSGYDLNSPKKDVSSSSNNAVSNSNIKTYQQHNHAGEVYNNSIDVTLLNSGDNVAVYSPKSYRVNSNAHKSPVVSHHYNHPAHRVPKTSPHVPARSPRTTRPDPYDMRQLSDGIIVGGIKFAGTIEEALLSLKTTLEDYQGQYPELQKLEEQVHYLDRMLKKNSPGSPTSDDVGISIEDALNAFDFLETEYYIDGYGSSGSSFEQLENKCNSLSPESTAKTSDSGIECLATRLTEDHPTSSSPDVQTTGNEQVDRAMMWHLSNCERLLENLGKFGPLKCKEIYALDKLNRQAVVIELLMKTARQFPGQIRDLQTVMSDLTKDMEMKKFWVRCTDHNVLFTSPERFLAQLERSYGEFIRQKYDITSVFVFKTLVARILDLPYFEPGMVRPSPIVTLHQMMSYFNKSDRKGLPDNLQQLAGEMWLMHRLQSGNTDVIVQTLLTFRSTLPPKQCMWIVAVLLVCDNMDVRNSAANYLQSVCAKEGLRKEAVVVYVEGLEDKNADIRCGSCVALKLLKAIESVEQLVYISSTDHSLMVQQRAKEAVLAFGDDGRKAYQSNQLATHGFQAVNIRL